MYKLCVVLNHRKRLTEIRKSLFRRRRPLLGAQISLGYLRITADGAKYLMLYINLYYCIF